MNFSFTAVSFDKLRTLLRLFYIQSMGASQGVMQDYALIANFLWIKFCGSIRESGTTRTCHLFR